MKQFTIIKKDITFLAVANHPLSADFALLWDKSAHFKAADCFECLLPHELTV